MTMIIMMKSGNSMKLQFIGSSITGGSHIIKNKQNQDNMKYKYIDFANIHLLSIADGHGGDFYIFSDVGSEIATCVSIELMEEFIEAYYFYFTYYSQQIDICDEALDFFQNYYPKELISRWKNKVDHHFASINKTDLKLSDIPTYQLYGSTLITIFISDLFIFFGQLGDGNIVRMNKNLKVYEVFEKNKICEFIGNDTYSLCLDNALEYFNIKIEKVTDTFEDIIIMASTDGYFNSFINKDGFYQVPIDIYQIYKENGLQFIIENLDEWLIETSLEGSGDDITTGIFIREV